MPYASASDLIARCDTQLVSDLVTDDDPETGIRERPALADLLENEVLATALEDASGAIEVAMRVGKRYSPAQLAGLAGNSQSHLKRVTCTIAIALLFERRPEKTMQDIAERYREQADKYITALQAGKNIFGLDDETDAAATLIDTDGPTSLDLTQNNLIDQRMHRYFPDGGTRLPTTRG